MTELRLPKRIHIAGANEDDIPELMPLVTAARALTRWWDLEDGPLAGSEDAILAVIAAAAPFLHPVAVVHVGDPDDRARTYNDGFDEGWAQAIDEVRHEVEDCDQKAPDADTRTAYREVLRRVGQLGAPR